MAVAVQADLGGIVQAKLACSASGIYAGSYQIESFVALGLPGGLRVERNDLVHQQPVARCRAEGGQVQRGPVCKGLGGAHGVDAGQKAADPFQHFKVIQLGLAPAAPGADGERNCLLYTSPSPRDRQKSRMPSSA